MPNGTEEEVMSEVIERAMEANVKLLVSNEVANSAQQQANNTAHAARVNVIAEKSLSDAVNFQAKTNDAYLEQANSQNKQYLQDTRFTMERLWIMDPKEAMAITTYIRLVIEALKAQGWQPPTP